MGVHPQTTVVAAEIGVRERTSSICVGSNCATIQCDRAPSSRPCNTAAPCAVGRNTACSRQCRGSVIRGEASSADVRTVLRTAAAYHNRGAARPVSFVDYSALHALDCGQRRASQLHRLSSAGNSGCARGGVGGGGRPKLELRERRDDVLGARPRRRDETG